MIGLEEVKAATITWLGETSVSFTEGANWIGGVAPADSLTADTALFNATPTTFQPVLSGSYALAGLTLSGGTTLSGGGTLTVGASGLTASGTNTISLAKIVVGANGTFNLINTTSISTEIDVNGRSLTIGTNLTSGLNLANVLLSGSGDLVFQAGSFNRSISVGGENTFNGAVSVDRTNLNFTTLANGGTASSFGSGTGDVTLGGGSSTVHITNTGAGGATDRLFKAVSGATTTPVISINNNGTGALQFNNAGVFGSHSLQLSGTYTGGVNRFASVITGGGSLVKAGASTWSLTSTTNSYTGATRINAGVLIVASLANGGQASSIGASNGTVGLLEFSGGTLRYEGSDAQTTNRLFTINTGGAILDASGTGGGTLQFTSTGSISSGSGAGARTLTLTGSNPGANSLAAALGNNGDGAVVSLTKSGPGRWIVSGANSYTGATTVSAGILEIQGSQGAATGAISIADGATLGGNGTTGATVVNGISGGLGTDRITAGPVLAGDVAGSVGTLSFASGVTMNHVTWLVDLVENSDGVSDLITVGGLLTLNHVTLELARTGAFIPGHSYILARYANLDGTFNGLANEASISGYQIHYGATAITLTAVPEPLTWLSLIGVGALVGWRRRRRTAS